MTDILKDKPNKKSFKVINDLDKDLRLNSKLPVHSKTKYKNPSECTILRNIDKNTFLSGQFNNSTRIIKPINDNHKYLIKKET